MKKLFAAAVALSAVSVGALVPSAQASAPSSGTPVKVKADSPSLMFNSVRFINVHYKKCLTAHGVKKSVTLEKCQKGKLSQQWINYGQSAFANKDGAFDSGCLAAAGMGRGASLQYCKTTKGGTWMYNSARWGDTTILGATRGLGALQSLDGKKVITGKNLQGSMKNRKMWLVGKP